MSLGLLLATVLTIFSRSVLLSLATYLQDVRRFVGIDAVSDDHIEPDVVAVNCFEQQVISCFSIAMGRLQRHLQILEFCVERVPVVDEGQENICGAGDIYLVFDAFSWRNTPTLTVLTPTSVSPVVRGMHPVSATLATESASSKRNASFGTSFAYIKQVQSLAEAQRVDTTLAIAWQNIVCSPCIRRPFSTPPSAPRPHLPKPHFLSFTRSASAKLYQ